MTRLAAYDNTIWLAEPPPLQRHIALATARPCPSSREVAEWKRELMGHAEELPTMAFKGTGIDHIDEMMILQHVSDAVRGIPNEAYDIRVQEFGVRTEAPRAIRAVKGKVGVIPIHGPVDQHASSELMKAGGTPLDFVSKAFDVLMNNASIGAVVLHVDSPGGSVYGTQELADKIYNARGTKPVYAMADSMAASAAYWIATAADMLVVTPGGEVGSVGVYVMHADMTDAMAAQGIKISMISAGKYKTEYATYSPLSEDAKVSLQARVDDTYTKFIDALSRNRGVSAETVRKRYGEGRMLTAEKAKDVGMADRVMTFEQLISKLTGSQPNGMALSGGPSAEVLRCREGWKRKRREI